MRYRVRRGDQEYGPYTLDELRRYTAQGNIVGSDLARGDDSQEWVRVDQLIGTAAGAVTPAPTYGAAPAYGPDLAGRPVPQGLHWALVLLLSFVTCGLFAIIWMFVEAVYATRLGPNCRAPLFYGLHIALMIAGEVLAATGDQSTVPIAGLLLLGAVVFAIAGHYSIKDALEKHLGLRLSGVMVLLFNVLYFQYHLSAVRERMVGQRA